jgi:hypothetical protein
MSMNEKNGEAGAQGTPGMPGEKRTARPAPTRERKRRPKVSLIGAVIVNVITLIVLAVFLLAVLLPGYRRSFTIARAVKGADEVWVMVKTSEKAVRENETDFLPAQDGLRNALQELVQSGGENVYAYVRDAYPARSWVEENLPEDMVSWLQGLFPAEEPAPAEERGGESPPQEEDSAGEENSGGEARAP